MVLLDSVGLVGEATEEAVGGRPRVDLSGHYLGMEVIGVDTEAQIAGSFVQPLDHDAIDLGGEAGGSPAGERSVCLEVGPVATDRSPQLVDAISSRGDRVDDRR
jgi:hypothetical protein